jgi:hypothetical protein
MKSNSFPKKYEASYVFISDDINRIYSLLTETENIEKLNQKTQLPYLFTDKPYPIKFDYSIGEITTGKYLISFSWNINSHEIPTPFIYFFKLTSNTLDNSILLNFEVIIVNPEKIPQEKFKKVINGCKKICVEMINNIEVFLQENNENIFVFESDIINAPREKVWDCLINLGEIFKKHHIIKEYCCEGEKEKVGSIVKIKKEKKEKIDEGSFKIVKIERNINKEKWTLVFRPLELKFHVQEMEFVLYKLEDNNTFIYINHTFKELLPQETMKDLQIKKKYLFNLIKKELGDEGK